MKPGDKLAADEVAALIETLHRTEQRLEELTGGEVDTVSSRSGHPFVLRRAQAQMRHSESAKQAAIAFKLQQRQTELQVLFDLMPAMIWFKDTRNGFLRVNQRVAEATGMTVGEIEGRSAEEIFPFEAAAYYADDLEVIRSRTPKLGIVERLRGPGGEERWVQTDKVPVQDRDGNVTGLIAMVHDITERKRADEALHESEARFLGAFEQAPSGVALVAPDGRWLKVNHALCELLGYPEAELLRRTFQDITHPEDLPENLENVRRLLAGEVRSYQMEKRFIQAQGKVVTVLLNVSLVRDASGQPGYFISHIHDISARKQAEAKLHREEVLLTSLISTIPDHIYIKDRQSRFMRINASMAQRIGLRDPAEAIGKTDMDLFTDEHAQPAFRQEQEMMATGESIVGLEEIETWADGSVTWASTTKVPLRNPAGEIVGLIGVSRDITERRESMEALRQSEARLRFLNNLTEATRLLASPDLIMAMMARLLGEHLRASRCAYADVGNDGEQFTILHDYTDGCASTVGNYQLSLFGPRAVATLRCGQTLVLRHVAEELLPGEGADMFNAIGIQAIITCPLIKDGRLRALMAVHQTTPRDWQPGEIAIVLEVVERCWATIERRTAEAQLRVSESLRRIAGRTSRLGGWAIDLPDGRITWSDEVCAIHEMPSGTVPGIGQALDFYAPRSRAIVSQAFAACVREGTPYDLELELTTAQGRAIWVRNIGEAQRNATGEIIRVQGALQDITERRQGMEALRESNEKFHQLADNITDAFWIRSPDMSRVQYVSPAFEKIWGRSVASLLANPHEWVDFILAEDRERVRTAFAALTDGRSTLEIEYRIVRPAGEIRWVHVRGFQVRNATDQLIRHIGIVTDITESKQLNEHLLQAQKMEALGQFSGGVAHDFNNILSAISGYTELAQMQLEGNLKVREYLGAVVKSTHRAADLVRQILTFSRQQPQVRDVMLLQPIVVESMKLMRATIPTTVEIGAAIAADAPTVLANANQVHQVLMNLAINGSHALKNHPGRLQVKLEKVAVDATYAASKPGLRPGTYARLSVSDTGCGMDPATLRRIFEPFFTTKPPGEGTGLGLAVVHGIMDSHDGAVTVHSQLGEGTVFRLYFPEHVGEAMVAAGEAGPTPRGQGERILVVDDEDMLAEMGANLLTRLGYNAESVTTSARALEIVRADPSRYALVLTDQTMPGMTGLQLASQLREIRPDLLLMLMTGYNLSLTADRVEASGIGDVLHKPFTMHALGTAVHAILTGATRHSRETNSPY